jgi:hypothetical protein
MIILFLNHKIQACGVYQYGLRIVNILKKSKKNIYIYIEIDDYSSYLNAINTYKPGMIIYNYHISTMPWLNASNIQHTVKNIVISHESPSSFFDYQLSIDPNEIETNNIYNIPRPIYENIDKIISDYKISNSEIDNFINYNEGYDVPIFGSFGFGFTNKGFDKIVDIINQNYDKAIIKLVITMAHFDQYNDVNYQKIYNLCFLKVTNPNIKLLIYNKFLTNEEILLFLSSNTANIFLYDTMYGRGISSVIDYAISVNKPLLISDSYMFRHIYNDDICVYKTNIKDAISNSIKQLPELMNKYSNKNLIDKVDNIISEKTMENKFKSCISAYYYIQNNTQGNVTTILYDLYRQYKYQCKNTFVVSNDIFVDTIYGKAKKLYINIITDITITLEFSENQDVSWYNIDKYIDFLNTDNQTNIHIIDVSIGEIIDKYSILELKKKYITDVIKLNDIEKEMNVLDKKVNLSKKTYYYKLLLHINDMIWKDTDKIKQITDINESNKDIFINLSKNIFENNQKRFRLKKYFNELHNSNIKECKSYSDDVCFINIKSENDIYDKIPEINYLCISYDIIYFSNLYTNIINKLFTNPNIRFIEYNNSNISTIYDLSTYNIEEDIRENFEFDTIKYKSGGKLGDYLNQLSVICENFYKTGKKGEIFIYDLDQSDAKFQFGIQHTYSDTYSTISSQKYIKNYNIYNNQSIDIDLSSWRNSLTLDNWYNIYNTKYNIDWGNHKWLTTSIDTKWNDKIIINITPYRFISPNVINILLEKVKDETTNCIFISNEKEHYDFFVDNTKLNIEFYNPKNFEETTIIINSCKTCFFGFSSMAVIANALHKPHYLMGINNPNFILNNLKQIIPHILDIFV